MNICRRNPVIFIVLLWLIVQVTLLCLHGIVTDGEATKYIEEANTLAATGHMSSPNFWLYFTQIFLLLSAITLKAGYIPVVCVQLLLNLWATICLYRFTSWLFSWQAGMFCTIFFLLNIPLQEFNTFLQTESIFYSLTIIFSAYLLRLKELNARNFSIVFLLLVLLAFTRPTGLLFVPPAFLYLFFRFFKGIAFYLKIITVTGVSIIFLFLLNLALGSGGELDFMLPFRDERIICGVPTLPYFVPIKTAENGNSLYGLFYYLVHNFGQFSRLALRRSMAFFGLVRTYYSTAHNIFLGFFFYPFYVLVLASLRYWLKKVPHLLFFLATTILVNWGTVILTCDDWHNRFYLTISPYLFILALPIIHHYFVKPAGYDRTDSN